MTDHNAHRQHDLRSLTSTMLLELEHTAVEFARLAGAEIMTALHRTLSVRYKTAAQSEYAPIDPISEVDQRVEELIRNRLAERFPAHDIIGEEIIILPTGAATRVNQLALGIQHMKVPERSPGLWNNVSRCCGNAGVSEFFMALHRRTKDVRHLAFAEDVAHDTLARATSEGDGLKWVQAEHRVRPELLVAQTGLMQGAAGVGLAMLHLDGAREGRKPLVRLPDDPF